ncbi:uncharacterized protein LOC134684130 [Mytilus trossulus]|uniref:uncharacterized protein LOC134684130 n=1 Tax=Mytilus trossulus TaxID=6551 RepID=UPI00300690DD
MSTNTSLCAICDLRHLTAASTHWCPECEESLCNNCKEHHSFSKSSRGHQVIHISEYNNLPSIITNINSFCPYHNEKYTQYCVKHEVPICFKCIKEHGNCSDLALLEDLARDIKSSELFRDMEQSLNDLKVNFNKIRENREYNILTIKDKKKQIVEDVSCFKKQINLHIDKLQEDFLKELDKVETECCEKIYSTVSSINDQYTEIIQYNVEIENINKYASDLQAFLGMREIQKNINTSEHCIQSMVQKKNLERVGLDFDIDTKLREFLTNVRKFGSILVDSCQTDNIELVRKKDRQAQILATEEQSINNIKLNFKRKLRTSCNITKGCCVTAKCEYLFTDYNECNEKLVVLNSNGKAVYTIDLSEPYSAFDLVCIDDNIVAVSTGYSNGNTGVIIIDLTTRKVKRFVKLPCTPYGITFDGESVICCSDGNDIHISMKDFCCTDIPSPCMSQDSYIAKQGDNTVYSVPDANKVFCLDEGTLVWEFKNDSVLKNQGGITVDDKGNVFVVGMSSKNIVVISPDGKQHKEIQIKECGLTEPSTICFDKINKQMLVTNVCNFAHLYDISYC